MDFMQLGIAALIFLVALLYSSVGHGGASGYLAVLSFFAFAPAEMATTALILNILVASLSCYAFYRAGHFCWSLTWPFLIVSIPAAFLGGLITISEHTYYLLLAVALLFAAYRMLAQQFSPIAQESKQSSPVNLPVAYLSGMGIGLLSGIIGVGGGIFLSPLIMLMRWADPKATAATSALFIVVNAAAGLLGRLAREGIVVGDLGLLIIVGVLGGIVGSYLGSRRYADLTLRKVLAVVLLLAAFKLVLQSGIVPGF